MLPVWHVRGPFVPVPMKGQRARASRRGLSLGYAHGMARGQPRYENKGQGARARGSAALDAQARAGLRASGVVHWAGQMGMHCPGALGSACSLQ